MQPLTYAVTIPSALSLFSLCFTIYRSEFQWSPASRFLCVALVSWLVAGLQGVELATIRYDQVAHNTLWIVGHFHNMALLNIGLVIFAGIYAYLPALVGREWSSTRLADWHLALTVIGGYGSVVPWMLQGLEGAPRRFAVLPHQYLTLSQLSLPFIALIVVGQALFLINLVRTLRPWLAAQVTRPAAQPSITPRERPAEALGGLLAALGVGLSLVCLWDKPFLWAPIGILLGYTAITMNARRQGVATMGAATLLLVLGLLVGA
jgi:cytochrome c oxidase subunit I